MRLDLINPSRVSVSATMLYLDLSTCKFASYHHLSLRVQFSDVGMCETNHDASDILLKEALNTHANS